MKKFFTLIAVAAMTLTASAQVQTIASYTVTTGSTLAGDDNTADAGTACTVQLHGNAVDTKDETNYGLKLDSDAKYVQIDLDEALEAGDQVNVSYFMGSNIDAAEPDNKHGVQLLNLKPGTEGSEVLATMYAKSTDKKNVVTKAYTAVGGEKKFFVYKLAESSSVYFNKVEVKRGSTPQTTGTTWNFTVLSSSDETALSSDATNWEAKTGDGDSGWANKTVLTSRNVYTALKAGGSELELTKGLQFTRDNNSGIDAGKIFIKKNKAINIAGNKILVKVPNLAKGDIVRVKFFSNADASRGFDVTNADKTQIMSSGKTDIQAVELTVAADGDLTLSSTASVNVQSITVNAALPTAVEGIVESKSEAKKAVKVLGANGIQIGNYNIAGQQVK